MIMSRSEKCEIVARFRREAPVDLAALARALGLEVEYRHLPDEFAGTIEPLAGHERFRIVVNEAHTLGRQRFSLAHLIGHTVLHRHLIGSGMIEGRGYRSVGWGYCHNMRIGCHEDIEANRFALTLAASPSQRAMRQAFGAGASDPSALPAFHEPQGLPALDRSA